MSSITKELELNEKIKDKVIAGATSSLTTFALKFEDGTGLLVETSGNPESPQIAGKLMPATELPSIGDAVCKVDWSWIVSSKVGSVQTPTSAIELNLIPAGKLRIQSQVWQGSLFLSFMPYRGAK